MSKNGDSKCVVYVMQGIEAYGFSPHKDSASGQNLLHSLDYRSLTDLVLKEVLHIRNFTILISWVLFKHYDSWSDGLIDG